MLTHRGSAGLAGSQAGKFGTGPSEFLVASEGEVQAFGAIALLIGGAVTALYLLTVGSVVRRMDVPEDSG